MIVTTDLLQILLEWLCALFNIVCCIYILAGQKINTRRCVIMVEFLLATTVYVLADAGAIYFRGNTSEMGHFLERFSAFISHSGHYVLAILALNYMQLFINKEQTAMKPGFRILVYGMSVAGIIAAAISNFSGLFYSFDENNIHIRGHYYWVISLWGSVLIVCLLLIALYYKKYMDNLEFLPLLLLFTIPLAANLMQLFIEGLSLETIGIGIATIIMFICYEVERSRRLVEQEHLLGTQELEMAKQEHLLVQQELEMAQQQQAFVEQQKELMEQRTQLMLSQIQPHFMYNTLASIEAMCEIDPKMARKAIHQFSRYLRLNMGNLTGPGLITFSKELEYVDTYIWIEKMRFQERLNMEYDLKITGFEIPSLTLQPIVENAVKHGVCALDEGGTVRISTWEGDGEIVIQVEDNGQGFDQEAIENDGKTHTGIKNVRERLKSLCNGTLEIESTVGKGTISRIRLPDIREKEEQAMDV